MKKIHNILFTLAGLGLILFFIFIMFDDNGFLALNRMKMEKNLLVAENSKIYQENRTLSRKINRATNDLKYIESIAREELGMIGKDELIYEFKRK